MTLQLLWPQSLFIKFLPQHPQHPSSLPPATVLPEAIADHPVNRIAASPKVEWLDSLVCPI